MDETRRKVVGFLVIAVTVLSVLSGYFSCPYIYKYLYKLCIYGVIAGFWSAIVAVGIGILDVLSCIKKVVQWAIEKINSFQFILKCFAYVILALVYACALFGAFVVGVEVRNTVEESKVYENGDIKCLNDLKSDNKIYITVVLEDGSEPQDSNIEYEILYVEPKELPRWQMILDFPRYFMCKQAGAGPIKVIVKPAEFPDVIVRFFDPLVSHGAETVIWISDPDLLGDSSVQTQNDYSNFFEYSYDDNKWEKHTICGTENRLPVKQERVWLRWNNSWEFSHRDILKDQKYPVKAGDVVNFYYPGERVEFDLNMIRNSKTSNSIFLHKLKAAEQYQLSLESVDSQTVGCDKNLKINSIISASSSPELPPCIIKTGTEIFYHCYDGLNDLGYYYIIIDHETVVWEEITLRQGEAIVLRLDMWID